MSTLRAKCPDCGGYTAVAIGPGYECHSCGKEFGAGLLRVPRAWGVGGEPMVEGARLPLPYPEVAVVEEATLAEQTFAVAADLPDRPLVLGGCCCAHMGAIEALSARHDRIAVIWFDAHGDLNTIESSPTGNPWATPLRQVIDSGAVRAEDVALVGARSLDPPEEEFIARTGVGIGVEAIPATLEKTKCVYVAFDADVAEPGELEMFMPEPDGLKVDEAEAIFTDIAADAAVLGAGFTAHMPDERNVQPLARLAHALGL